MWKWSSKADVYSTVGITSERVTERILEGMCVCVCVCGWVGRRERERVVCEKGRENGS